MFENHFETLKEDFINAFTVGASPDKQFSVVTLSFVHLLISITNKNLKTCWHLFKMRILAQISDNSRS